MKNLTDLQQEFINLLESRFQVEPSQIGIFDEEKIPYFENLFQVEEHLKEIKQQYGFRDSLDEPEALPL